VSLGVATDARADEPHTLCLDFPIGDDFWDASAPGGNEFWENFGRNEGSRPYPGRRWLARITEIDGASQTVRWGWAPLDDDGCAHFTVTDVDVDLRVQWVRWAHWNDELDETAAQTGNQIVGYACTEATTQLIGNCEFGLPGLVEVEADSGGTTIVTTDTLGETQDLLAVDLPFWAMTFAEERFADMGQQHHSGLTTYVAWDPGGAIPNPGGANASYMFGSQPSVSLSGDGWRSKFKAAHEYGHVQTILAGTDFDPGDLDDSYNNQGGHGFMSHEWQALAAVEGMAHWYAVATWNDVDLPTTCENCVNSARFTQVNSETEQILYRMPRSAINGPVCELDSVIVCADGVGNEWDWASALREFRRLHGADFGVLFQMLSVVYDPQTWVASGETDDFWQLFDGGMQGHLGALHSDWVDVAEDWRLDR
jgi:hypothetical protein